MHLVDVGSKSQESDDIHMTAWYQFYQAVLNQKKSIEEVCQELGTALWVRRTDDEDESKMLFHTLLFLSSVWKSSACFSEVFSRPRNFPVTTASTLHPTPDRLWALARSPHINNPFVLNQLSRRQLAIYAYSESPTERDYVNIIAEVNIAIRLDMGVNFCRSLLSPIEDWEVHVPSSILNNLHGNPNLCVKLDKLLTLPKLPVSAIYRQLMSGLAGSTPIQHSRFLLRLALLKSRMNQPTDALLLLEDIQDTVLANCTQIDIGLLYMAKAEALLFLARDLAETEEVLSDCSQLLQEAIAAFHTSPQTPYLLGCIVLAELVAKKRGQVELENTYKRMQNAQNMDEVMPQLESKPHGSPIPTSPVGGRGIQTLIAWNT